MDLIKIYSAVNDILSTLDFNLLFPGFYKYRFALYNSREICFDGKMISSQENFMGNTAIEYNGEYIAIWNMELDPIEDVELLAFSLVHEMFHCHQRKMGETRFPSDFLLLNYPHDIDNFIKKYNENLHLAEAYEKKDLNSLQKFACIRNMRMQKYPDMVLQELNAETAEGMAEYVGLRALRTINNEKFIKVVTGHIDKLRSQDNLLFDIRRISYYSGAVFLLCLDCLGITVSNDFNSSMTVYEQNPVSFGNAAVTITGYAFISDGYRELLAQKKKIVAAHMENAQYMPCNASICGYDPMNMFRIDDLIFCKNFVFLKVNGEVKSIRSAVLLKLADNSDQTVMGYYVQKPI